MRHCLVFFALFCTACASREPHDLAAILEPIRAKTGIPALGGAIVTSEGLQALGAVGLRSAEAQQQVSVEDQWHIGSCTKSMTATLAARLVEQGLLRWESTVGEVLAPSMPSLHPAWGNVQLLWLLNHRSGMSFNFPDSLWTAMVERVESPREQRRWVVEATLAKGPEQEPNTVTAYSNAAYILVGVMLEQLAQSSWEELIAREVFTPLGMTHTGFGAPGTAGALDQPLGHAKEEGGWSPVEVGPSADNPAATGPAGTVHTTLGDWARFAAAHLRGAAGDESFLKRDSWAMLQTPVTPDATTTAGWQLGQSDWSGGPLLSHLGSNSLWVAQISLAPAKDLAILLVTNLGDDAAEPAFGESLVKLVEESKRF